MRKLLLLVGLLSFFLTEKMNSQSIATEFGKNRVQYHDAYHKWWTYETENFITYWYGKGKNIGQFVVQMAEYDHDDIQNIMEHRINDKIEIIVYLDQSDLKQSNIGTSETFESSHGNTTIIGNKMFVYYDGNHRNLRKQIRKGIANAYLNAMFTKGSLQEIVQNSLSLDLPEWFAQGIVSYIAEDWDYLIEDELRDLWASEKPNYRDFDKIGRLQPKIAGHSFWYFISQQYGTATISNILYLTRLDRNLDDSFKFVLGQSYDSIIREWERFYTGLYEQEADFFEDKELATELDLSNKAHVPISTLRLSPDATELAYAYNDIGKIRINLYNFETQEEITVFKHGYRNNVQEPDYNYPLIAWHPNGDEITIVYEFRDKIHLLKKNLANGEEQEQILPEDIQRVYSISYKTDLDYIMSATTDGYSNIHIYYSRGRQHEKLTDDYFDDIDAHYISFNGTNGILYSSNKIPDVLDATRMDTILPIHPFNTYFMPFDEKQGEIIQLSDSKIESERNPFLIDDGKLVYLGYSTGMKNRYVYDGNENKHYINSDKSRNIIKHHAVAGSDKYVYTLYQNGAYKVFVEYPDLSKTVNATNLSTAVQELNEEQQNTVGVLELTEEEELKYEYTFQSAFKDPKNIKPLDSGTTEINIFSNNLPASSVDFENDQKNVIEFVSARAVAARSKFKLEDFTTSVDNSVLFEGLESYTQDQTELNNTPVGLLMKGIVTDLFEDYRITGGIRIPTGLNGLESFVVYDDNRALIDKRFALYRRAVSNTEQDFAFPSQRTKATSLLGLYRLKYPLDVYTSIRGTAQLRFDRFFFLHTDDFSVAQPNDNEKRISLKGEYVFDNTIPKDDNVLWGTRYKAYVELINRFEINTQDGITFEPSRGFTTVIGFDFRHYIPVLNHAIIALRGSGATSFGSDNILYYVGGVENAIGSTFNQDIGIPPDREFAFQVVAPHLRGFQTNIRNGTTYVLANSEFRLPLFKYFSKRRIRSSFFRNFMLVGFFDAGTAWHGLTPGGTDNPINTATVSQPPLLEINVRFFRDPLVLGYGLGARATLLGYNVRVDYGWGVESRQIQNPRLHIALGIDF